MCNAVLEIMTNFIKRRGENDYPQPAACINNSFAALRGCGDSRSHSLEWTWQSKQRFSRYEA